MAKKKNPDEMTAAELEALGWKRVVFTADCRECSDCGEPVCPVCDEHYADCECPGPTQDGFEHEMSADGVLMARETGDDE